LGYELAGDEDDCARNVAAVVDGAALRNRCGRSSHAVVAERRLIIPKRGDVAVVLSTSLLHMTAYSALIAAGLQFLPAGRAIVLGYTTPIWVTIGARILLSEAITTRRAIGVCLGLVGLAVIFRSRSVNWSDRNSLVGSGLIMLAALCWAANIVYVRVHKWIATPFQLVFWQVLLACIILSILGALVDGAPGIMWTPRLLALLLFSGIVCTALAHLAMSMVNRSPSAVTTSLGLLATPALSATFLGEAFEPWLFRGACFDRRWDRDRYRWRS
jgi:drug/metabolite transporter (DMT)-like permease